jgi:hypothetical protein
MLPFDLDHRGRLAVDRADLHSRDSFAALRFSRLSAPAATDTPASITAPSGIAIPICDMSPPIYLFSECTHMRIKAMAEIRD